MDQLMTFVQDRWIVIAAAVIVLLIIVNIVKTVVKWVIALIIIALVFVYGANYIDDLKNMDMKQISGKIAEYTKTEAVDALIAEAKEAKYEENADGTFTVKTKNFELTGKTGSADATLSYKGHSVKVPMGEALKAFVNEVKIAN